MSTNKSRSWFVGVALVGALGASILRAAESETAEQVFQRRILPIFKSPNPSSCTQCHLGGVDLKHYILPSHEKTFLSLRDQGLIDADKPDASKILKLINMRETDNPGADLIHEKTRQAEYEAFATWIKACVADSRLMAAPKLKPAELAQAKKPVEVIRHGRKDRLLESFENNIWAMRFRCMSCHIEGSKENDKLKAEHGDQVAWMKAAGPEATMNYLIASKLIDVKQPEKSLLLLKPLKVVDHVGGKKFIMGDQGYRAFRTWIEDYAKIVNEQYATAASLPDLDTNHERFGTEIWIKLSNTLPAWGDNLLQADVYAWDASKNAWETEPIASADRANFAKGRLWQHTLTLIAATGSQRAAQWKRGRPALDDGKYLVKVYVDQRGRVASNWTATLGLSDYVGQTEVQSSWPARYGRMTVVDASKLKP